MKVFLAAVFAFVLVSSVLCDQWALLVAGSEGYFNYRHQADICHAYHVLHNHGIPDKRIVVMMFDDIAHNNLNPYPGNIINKPNGKNLYPGVLKDYTGYDITPDVFLKVLTGDQEGLEKILGRKSKVIKSGPNDTIFVYFSDHGAPGLIVLPVNELHAESLNDAILKMHKNKQYKEMVFYIEACESGSMFQNILRKDINVYATTASNPDQASYPTYWNEDRHTFLGDVYSVKWMEDSDVKNLNKETLGEQFRIVRKKTNTSTVMEYGDLSMADRKIAEFQGNLSREDFKSNQDDEFENDALMDAIPSQYVPVETLRRQTEAAVGKQKVILERAYQTLLRLNKETVKFFEHIVHSVSDRQNYQQLLRTSIHFTDFKCYRESIQIIKTACPGLELLKNDIALRNLRVLANLCESGIPKENIWRAIEDVATKSSIC